MDKYVSKTLTTVVPEDGTFDDIIEKLFNDLDTWKHSNRASVDVIVKDSRFPGQVHVKIVVDK